MTDWSDYSSLQQPTGGYGTSSPSSGYGNAPFRVADADKPKTEPRTRQTKWKAVKDGPHQKTSTIYLLFYLSEISRSYTFDTFLERLHGSSDPNRWPETSDFIAQNVDIVRKSKSATAWSDLGNGINEPGAIVIYWGHSERADSAKKARNLRPRADPTDNSADIPVANIASLLKSANAKAFIVAACATDGCIGKIDRDTAIIATNSGKDLLTWSYNWANVLDKFLNKFIAGGAIADCITEGNKAFAGSDDPDDSFVLASGLGSMTSSS